MTLRMNKLIFLVILLALTVNGRKRKQPIANDAVKPEEKLSSTTHPNVVDVTEDLTGLTQELTEPKNSYTYKADHMPTTTWPPTVKYTTHDAINERPIVINNFNGKLYHFGKLDDTVLKGKAHNDSFNTKGNHGYSKSSGDIMGKGANLYVLFIVIIPFYLF